MLANSVLHVLQKHGFNCCKSINTNSPFEIICIDDTLYLHFIDLKTYSEHQISENFLFEFMSVCHQKKIKCFTVFEDEWHNHSKIIISRIYHQLKKSTRIYARALNFNYTTKNDTNAFFTANHLQGSVNGWKNISLEKNGVFALATFSKSRLMNYEKPFYRSYELIRFATKINYSVTGGLSKIIKHFIELNGAQHIMTYSDNAFGNGEGFIQSGFKFVENMPPQAFFISQNLERIAATKIAATVPAKWIKVYNTGSKKFVLDIR